MSDRFKETSVIVDNKEIAPGIFDMLLEAKASGTALPGQFVMVYPKGESRLLPRPISICDCDKKKGTLRLVYRVAGKGTGEFSHLQKGDEIDILGPIGNGFPVEKAAGKNPLLLGGGIGIPPLVYLAKALKQENPGDLTAALGYRDSTLFLNKDVEANARILIATEDGSLGTAGNVLTAVDESGIHPDVIYACGPMPMLRAIKTYAQKAGIKAYISLEERMACGVGACLGCVCSTTETDHHSHVKNARVCTEGPVFDAEEVEI